MQGDKLMQSFVPVYQLKNVKKYDRTVLRTDRNGIR